MENATQPKKVCFPVNENGWILLFQNRPSEVFLPAPSLCTAENGDLRRQDRSTKN